MKITKKFIFLFLILLFSFTFAQNSDYEDYEENVKDTVIINGAKYARVVDEDYFEDLEYDDGMWSIAPGYGFGLIKGSTFSTIPSGYTINIITPYGFDVGPSLLQISFALGVLKQNIIKFLLIILGSQLEILFTAVNPFYIGIGGDLNFSESIYSEGHIGMIGSGLGFRGFLGFDTGNLGSALGNDLDINLMIGSEFYLSSEITKEVIPLTGLLFH